MLAAAPPDAGLVVVVGCCCCCCCVGCVGCCCCCWCWCCCCYYCCCYCCCCCCYCCCCCCCRARPLYVSLEGGRASIRGLYLSYLPPSQWSLFRTRGLLLSMVEAESSSLSLSEPHITTSLVRSLSYLSTRRRPVRLQGLVQSRPLRRSRAHAAARQRASSRVALGASR